MSSAMRTYQTRCRVSAADDALLAGYAEPFGRMERTLFARLRAGEALKALKKAFQPRFGVTARQFNAAAAQLEGRIKAVREARADTMQSTKRRITRAKQILRRTESANKAFVVHQKKRRLAALNTRLTQLQSDCKNDTVRLCFGSRRLFRAQFAPECTSDSAHAAWKSEWTRARESQFFVIGSHDETAGCQGCVATLNADGTVNLRLRLLNAQAPHKYLVLTGLHFNHGHTALVAALGRNASPDKSEHTPISYRFCREERGWRVFVTVAMPKTTPVSIGTNGVLAIDINADHLAVTETDRFGNLVASERITCNTRGKSKDARRAVIGDAIKKIVAWAVRVKKPIALEKLDFAAKKAGSESRSRRRNRTLSSFAYSQIHAVLCARAYDSGIEIRRVNPAYTSVIGASKYACRYGVSSHQAAALAIGRRAQGFCEKVPSQLQVTLPPSARKRGKHVWSVWAKIARVAQATHAASGESRRARNRPRDPGRLSPEQGVPLCDLLF